MSVMHLPLQMLRTILRLFKLPVTLLLRLALSCSSSILGSLRRLFLSKLNLCKEPDKLVRRKPQDTTDIGIPFTEISAHSVPFSGNASVIPTSTPAAVPENDGGSARHEHDTCSINVDPVADATSATNEHLAIDEKNTGDGHATRVPPGRLLVEYMPLETPRYSRRASKPKKRPRRGYPAQLESNVNALKRPK